MASASDAGAASIANNPEHNQSTQRKKIKAKRRLQGAAQEQKMTTGEESKNEVDSDLSFEDSQEDEFEVEDVVQRPDDSDEEVDGAEWEDCDDSSDDD